MSIGIEEHNSWLWIFTYVPRLYSYTKVGLKGSNEILLLVLGFVILQVIPILKLASIDVTMWEYFTQIRSAHASLLFLQTTLLFINWKIVNKQKPHEILTIGKWLWPTSLVVCIEDYYSYTKSCESKLK
jgi:hypothetical protein